MNKKLLLFFGLLIGAKLSVGQAPSILWQKCYGGTNNDIFRGIVKINSNEFILAGNTQSNDGDILGNHGNTDGWVVKVDDNSNLIWQKCIGGSDVDNITAIIQSNDGNIICVGSTYSNDGDVFGNHGSNDGWVVKLAITDGSIIWQHCYGGSIDEGFLDVIETNDSGLILVGVSNSSDGDTWGGGFHGGYSDFWVVKVDKNGMLAWQKCYGGSDDDIAFAIVNKLGSWLIGGISNSSDFDVSNAIGVNDYWVIKIDSLGFLIWEMSFGGTNQDYLTDIVVGNSGNFYLCGNSYSTDFNAISNHGSNFSSDILVVSINDFGLVQWSKCFGGTHDDWPSQIIESKDTCLVVIGTTNSDDGDVLGNHNPNSGTDDIWLIKFDSTGILIWQKCLGGSSEESGNCVFAGINNELIVSGIASSLDGDLTGSNNHGADCWIVNLINLQLDAALPQIIYPAVAPLCDNLFNPVIEIRNNAQDTITSMTINFRLDSMNLQSVNWIGQLLPDSFETVVLPSIFASAGSHSINVYLSDPNGAVDENHLNDTLVKTFVIDQDFSAVPFFEGFQDTLFPPPKWSFNDPANIIIHNTATGGFGNSDSCMEVKFFYSSLYRTCSVVSPQIELTNLLPPVFLTFSIASAMINSSSMKFMAIYVSVDCGETWNLINIKSDSMLASSGLHATNFIPQAGEWRTDSVDLTSFIGLDHLQFGFIIGGQTTNNVYIDDINILDGQSKIYSTESYSIIFNAYFTSDNSLQITINSQTEENAGLSFIDLTGRELFKTSIRIVPGYNLAKLNIPSLPFGIYLVRIETAQGSITKKVSNGQ